MGAKENALAFRRQLPTSGHPERVRHVAIGDKKLHVLLLQARQQVLPERIGELAASFFKSSKRVAGTASIIMASATTNLAPSDILADIGLCCIGMQWHLRCIEDSEQLFFMSAELLHGQIETIVMRVTLTKDFIKAHSPSLTSAPLKDGLGSP